MIKEFVPLRFALILMIFFHHAADYGGGWVGVAFFFVLSGFCMTLGYHDKVISSDFSYIKYLKNRFRKFYILHWITLLVVLGLMIWHKRTIGYIGNLLTNMMLLQSWVPDASVYFSYNPVSWYLSTAIFAIVIFPMLVLFLERLTTCEKITFGTLILITYIVVVFRTPATMRHAMLYIHPVARLADFIIGIYLAYAYNKMKNIEQIMMWAQKHCTLLDVGFLAGMITLLTMGLVVQDQYRPIAGILWIPIAISLICLTLGQDNKTWLHKILQMKIIGIFSQCSFSLMMWHIIVIENCITVDGAWCNLLIKFITSYIVAQGSYYLIEKKGIKHILCR